MEPSSSNVPSGLRSRVPTDSSAPLSPASTAPASGNPFMPHSPSPSTSSTRTSYSSSSGGSGTAPMVISSLALIIAVVALFVAFALPHPISSDQKQQLKGISNSLRDIQKKDITMTTPIKTTVYIDKSFPLQDIFPPTFTLPIAFSVPVNTQLVGMSSSGQPVVFRVNDSVQVVASVPIDSEKTFGNSYIVIKKEIPIESRFNADVNVKSAFGGEINSIIDKLDKMAE